MQTMKRQQKLLGLVAGFLTLTLLAACQQSANGAIKEGIKKLTTQVTSLSYDLSLQGDIKDAGKSTKFNFTLNGGGDLKDVKDPRLTVKLDGSLDSDGQAGSANLDFRFGKDAVYFNLMKLSMGATELPPEITTLLNKWWKYAIPKEAMDQISTSLPALGKADADLTPQGKQFKQLFQDANFFSQSALVGTEDVKGEKSYHYSATVDKTGVLNFLKGASQIQDGNTITPEEFATAEKSLANVDIKSDVWVGATSGILNKVVATLTMKDSGDGTSGVININLAIGDFNKAVAIEGPAGAEDFPLEQVLQMFGGAPTAADGSDSQMVVPDSATMLAPADSAGVPATSIPVVPAPAATGSQQ